MTIEVLCFSAAADEDWPFTLNSVCGSNRAGMAFAFAGLKSSVRNRDRWPGPDLCLYRPRQARPGHIESQAGCQHKQAENVVAKQMVSF